MKTCGILLHVSICIPTTLLLKIISTFLFMSHSYAHNASWIPFGADAICHCMIMLWIRAATYSAADGAIVKVPVMSEFLLNCCCTFFCPQEEECKEKWKKVRSVWKKILCLLGKCITAGAEWKSKVMIHKDALLTIPVLDLWWSHEPHRNRKCIFKAKRCFVNEKKQNHFNFVRLNLKSPLLMGVYSYKLTLYPLICNLKGIWVMVHWKKSQPWHTSPLFNSWCFPQRQKWFCYF